MNVSDGGIAVHKTKNMPNHVNGKYLHIKRTRSIENCIANDTNAQRYMLSNWVIFEGYVNICK